jgi:hypothetical protein
VSNCSCRGALRNTGDMRCRRGRNACVCHSQLWSMRDQLMQQRPHGPERRAPFVLNGYHVRRTVMLALPCATVNAGTSTLSSCCPSRCLPCASLCGVLHFQPQATVFEVGLLSEVPGRVLLPWDRKPAHRTGCDLPRRELLPGGRTRGDEV